MRKLTIVYENFNKDNMTGWNNNGRFEPTKIPPPVSFNNFFEEKVYNLLFNSTGNPDKIPCSWLPYYGILGSNFYEIKTISELEENERYVYPINIFNISVFIQYNSHISINEKILSDAKQGKCFILFVYPNEGHLVYFLSKFEELIKPLNVPKENILVLHADYNKENFKQCSFTYIPVCIFPWWVKLSSIQNCIEYTPEKIFVCHNKEVRIDRMTFLLELWKNNLLDLGYFSCGHLHSLDSFDEEEKTFLKSIEGISPDNIKIYGDDRENPANVIDFESAKKSFCTIVTETEARTDEIVYFTEKTFKPILLGHPFMILGGKDQLKKLKDFGYRTFNKWWDESYDTETGFVNRINKIIKNISTLKEKTPSELVAIRTEMQEVLYHNQKLYLKTVSIRQDDYTSKILLNHIYK